MAVGCKKCDCEKEKEQFEKDCPHNCRCMSDDEYNAITNKPKFSHLSDNQSRLQDRGFVSELVGNQYTQDNKNCGSGETRESCQKKSKCVLRKYTATKGKNNKCCPGQTGHHLIPDSAFRSNPGACQSHGMALTVCVAGSSHSVGTHGLMHSATKETFLKLCSTKTNGKASYKELKKASLEAFGEIFSSSGCDLKCLEIDLDESYNDINKKKKKKNKCKSLKRSKYDCNKYGSAAADPEIKKHLNDMSSMIGSNFNVS